MYEKKVRIMLCLPPFFSENVAAGLFLAFYHVKCGSRVIRLRGGVNIPPPNREVLLSEPNFGNWV